MFLRALSTAFWSRAPKYHSLGNISEKIMTVPGSISLNIWSRLIISCRSWHAVTLRMSFEPMCKISKSGPGKRCNMSTKVFRILGTCPPRMPVQVVFTPGKWRPCLLAHCSSQYTKECPTTHNEGFCFPISTKIKNDSRKAPHY